MKHLDLLVCGAWLRRARRQTESRTGVAVVAIVP